MTIELRGAGRELVHVASRFAYNAVFKPPTNLAA
jgi:hypothetical protein